MSILSQQKQSQAPDFPNLRPSLDLRFALAKKLDPRITFTRSSGGSYVGADGLMKTAGVNEPRFDHDPITGQSLGLLIEEQRINLYTRSDIEGTVGAQPTGMQLFGPSNGQTAVVSTDVSLGPNGQSCKHTRGTWSDNNIGYFGSGTVTAGSTYVFSVYVYIPSSQAKNFEGKLIFCDMENAFTSRTRASADVTIVDRWQRIWGTCVPSTTSATWVLRTTANTGSFLYTDCWQLELGSLPTSYMPASGGSQFTRNPDNAQITGTNFSSWYRQDEGTVSISCITRWALNSGNATDFLISNSFTTTYTSRIIGWFNNLVTPYISVFVNNINILLPFIGVPGSSSNIPIKKAIALATRNMRVATNGTIITGNLGNTTVPNYLPNDFNRLLLGYEGIFAGYLNGTISRFTYYPKALPNSQLQALTR